MLDVHIPTDGCNKKKPIWKGSMKSTWKGCGEPPYGVPAPAIANAIYNAIGLRFTEIPINIRSILEGFKKGHG